MNKLYLSLLAALTVFAACTNETKKTPDPNLPPKYALTFEPKFKYQGNLQFLSEDGSEVQKLKIEIADDDAKREQGLMHRKSMNNDEGMLFIFPDERRRSFWMKNTHLALDIIFVNAEKQIIHIAENCEPYSLNGIPSFEYAQYVVEVNAGYCQKYSISVANPIEFKRNK